MSTFGNPEKVKLGRCKLIEEIMIGEDKVSMGCVECGRACGKGGVWGGWVCGSVGGWCEWEEHVGGVVCGEGGCVVVWEGGMSGRSMWEGWCVGRVGVW